jgi:hypothetical protein
MTHKILVYDDVREFRFPTISCPDAEITYCKTEDEFLKWMELDVAEFGDDDTGIGTLVLDHDLGFTFFGPEDSHHTTRRSIRTYVERLKRMPEEKRPWVYIVTANPAGKDHFVELFDGVCQTIIDFCGKEIGMWVP